MKIVRITKKEPVHTYDMEVINKHHYILENGCVSHNTAGVIGTTASVLPIYKKYFVETNSIAPSVVVAPNLSEKNFWYYKEYVNMNMNDVIDMISVIYKWIDQSISFEWIINPQKVSPKELYDYYLKSHKQGIKTIYYVRSMSLEIDRCESCSG